MRYRRTNSNVFVCVYLDIYEAVNSVTVINMIMNEMFSDFKCTITHQARAKKTKKVP